MDKETEKIVKSIRLMPNLFKDMNKIAIDSFLQKPGLNKDVLSFYDDNFIFKNKRFKINWRSNSIYFFDEELEIKLKLKGKSPFNDSNYIKDYYSFQIYLHDNMVFDSILVMFDHSGDYEWENVILCEKNQIESICTLLNL